MNSTPRDTRVADTLRLFQERGASQYGGESVSQLEHALQAAFFAERQGASTNLVAAALLHDVGHLLHVLPDDAPSDGVDDAHEELAARWLTDRFAPAVCEPVRMHVLAKRYLCTVDETYYGTLSKPSQVSMKLQGGTMSEEERRDFEALPFSEHAVQLRRWDDAAKVVGLRTPDLEHFAKFLATAD